MIPKHFHVTANSSELPRWAIANLERIKELYGDAEVTVHTDDDIDHFAREWSDEFYRRTFRHLKPKILKIDTIRYLWMDALGGIYCDLDVLFRQRVPFDRGAVFFEREWTYPRDPKINVSVHNCCFASEPGHPIWLELLRGIEETFHKSWRLDKRVLRRLHARLRRPYAYDGSAFNVTGPNAISRTITRGRLHRKYDDVTILPAWAIYQRGMSSGAIDDALVEHQAAASWR